MANKKMLMNEGISYLSDAFFYAKSDNLVLFLDEMQINTRHTINKCLTDDSFMDFRKLPTGLVDDLS